MSETKSPLPVLPTTTIGSYSLPVWLEHARALCAAGTMTPDQLLEAHDNAVRSAIKDQENAGVDVISDGELRRETMVYFFSARIHGFDMQGRLKPIGNLDSNIRMPDPVVVDKVRSLGSLGMEDHFAFLRDNTRAHTKVCVTGPHMLAKRATNEHYASDRELVFDLADILNADLKRVADAGCELIQIDEPVWVGHPQDMPWMVDAFNRLVSDVNAEICVHVCYGNYQLKRLFSGEYSELFPALLDVHAAQISLEFAVSDHAGPDLFTRFPTDKTIVAGVVDVKNPEIETAAAVAARIRHILDFIPAEQLWISPDCGMKFMPRDRAFAKLKAMVQGTRIVRHELGQE